MTLFGRKLNCDFDRPKPIPGIHLHISTKQAGPEVVEEMCDRRQYGPFDLLTRATMVVEGDAFTGRMDYYVG